MLRRLDFWTSCHRAALAIAVIVLLGVAVIASALQFRTAGTVAIVLSFAAFIGLATGIRHASGSDEGGGGISSIGNGGD